MDSAESIAQEANNSPQAITSSPSPAPSLEETLKALLAPLQQQLADLVADNKAVKSENEKLREELNNFLATPHAGNVVGDDFPVNPRAARSVVIATRPVMDNPERYAQKPIVDSGALVRNDASPLSGKNRGE